MNVVISWLVWLFLLVMIVVSLALGVLVAVSAFNARNKMTSVSQELHELLKHPAGSVALVVFGVIVAVGGTAFWYQEMQELSHKGVSENNLYN